MSTIVKESTASETSPHHEEAIKRLREQVLRPTAQRFGFPLASYSGNTIGVPMVLCLGNHSSGKSTFINHLAGAEVQATGVAPTDDCFTLITYGAVEETVDGRATVVDPALPFADFEQYGKDFLDHLKLKRVPLESLKGVFLIDSPGLIDHAGSASDSSRGYDFKAVVRAFAENADLVIFFFDPEKPGTTGESLRIFTDALSDVMYKLLIVFNKVDTFGDVRDFARTYGALCWNLSRVVRTKDMPHIYCTFVEGNNPGKQRQIDLADFVKSTEELKSQVARVGERRRTNVIGALLDATRLLRVHAAVCHRVGVRLMAYRISLLMTSLVLLGSSTWLLLYHRDNKTLLILGAIVLTLGIALMVGLPFLLRMRLKWLISKLDVLFHDIFSRELLEKSHSRYLYGLWESVKPRTVRFLQEVGPRGIPFSPFWHGRFRKLRQASETEIPQLLNGRKGA